jgi:hypothetical protein
LRRWGWGLNNSNFCGIPSQKIATANNISQDKASEKFFSDVQKQYDDKLGFELELNLKSEVQKSEHMQLELHDKAVALNSIILKQSDQIQQVSGFAEFVPLIRAANGQRVPKNELTVSQVGCYQGDRHISDML